MFVIGHLRLFSITSLVRIINEGTDTIQNIIKLISRVNKWLSHAIQLHRGTHVTYTDISLAKTSQMTSLTSMWQRCLICVFGRSHQHFYRSTVFKSSHLGCKYLLPFLPQSKHIHPLPKCNINHGMRFSDYSCTSSGCSIAWIYLPPLQSFYIVERARVTPVNTTIYKMQEWEVLSNHGSTTTLKFFW